ncbi:MAG: tRNA uridine-5-carboxymethylaminomethyl(34) synthesis GTPase MnmE [Saprospiraceae bacterium]|nr:tRNA uridine-5-carboxymethylaminomethyl(34) synthesis GTPase MnmE [Saprospiraceae bacterium]
MDYLYSSTENNDTICAISTAHGAGAIAVIRLSGKDSFKVCSDIFVPKSKNLKINEAPSHTIHYGEIKNGDEIIDEVLLSIFKSPNSYTGEDVVEISCHGSNYIQTKIIELLISKGVRHAKAGEFTFRAFMNGKFDLSQAEAVADIISSNSKTSHDLALMQMRGGYSTKINTLRKQLLDFMSLIELELDFSEEDVEFANRAKLKNLLVEIKLELNSLISSFSYGNVIKKGIPVAIIGHPNVGKSTLLNALLNEERAIVSELPGTTRDTVEDTININGILFRFIDTAGLRDSQDIIESIGIERTYEKINQASIILYVFDINEATCDEIEGSITEFKNYIKENLGDESKKFILVANKTDQLIQAPRGMKELFDLECIFISAKRKENIHLIAESLVNCVEMENISDSTIVSNLRHFEALKKSQNAIENVENGFASNTPSDLIAIDIKEALHYLGEITGEITNDEILGNIFGKFCVGK